MKVRLIFLLVVLFFGLNSLVYISAQKQQDNELTSQLNVALNGTAQLINNNLENNRRALMRMAHRWNVRGGTPEKLWRPDALAYVHDLAGAYGAGYADANSVIKWIEPVEQNRAALNFQLNTEERRRKAIEKAIASRSAQITDPITLKQGGFGFLMLNPVFRDEKLDGYVYLASRFDQYFSQVLIKDNYCLRFKFGEEFLYSNCEDNDFSKVKKYIVKKTNLIDLASAWQVELAPMASYLSLVKGNFITQVMTISLITTGFLVMLIFTLIDIRNKSKTIEVQNAELQVAKAKAEEGSKAKEDFLTTVSHEIRTPLNGIIGLANLLKDTSLNELQKDYVHHLNESGNLLLALVNDVLDLSKIDSGKFYLEEVNFSLEQAIDHIVSSFSYLAKSKNISLVTDFEQPIPHWVRGDVARFKQVLINLIGNAIKFSHKGSIVVKTRILSTSDDKVKIQVNVIDHGIGISKAHISKLFEKFVQVNRQVHSQFAGTGLGLAISRKIIEKMGGSIGVESEEGKGSDFFFVIEFPTGVEELISPYETKITKNIPSQKLRVLLAEDNIVNQKVAMAILNKYGYECQAVANGLEVLKILETIHFDVVLMDCLMPEMDGYEATRAIRKLSNPALNQIPIIALTANAMPEDRRKCLEAGMNDYITKPVSVHNLIDALSVVANSKR